MVELDLGKLQVKFIGEATATGPVSPRCYTLTHSDRTGHLFLSIGTRYDEAALLGWYTRLMRDEVLAAYQLDGEVLELHVHCHVSGGLVVGPAGWRLSIFKYHLPGVLQAFRRGDAAFIQVNPVFEKAQIQVHFNSPKKRYDTIENWGIFDEY